MTTLLDWFISHRPKTIVFVSQLIPNFYTSTTNAETIAFNNWLSTDIPTLGSQFQLVDMYPDFVDGNGNVNSSLFSSDTVHPDHAGYAVMGAQWYSSIESTVVAGDVPEPKSVALILAGGAIFLIPCFRRLILKR
jgi:lysophospholipase L1-like esterase